MPSLRRKPCTRWPASPTRMRGDALVLARVLAITRTAALPSSRPRGRPAPTRCGVGGRIGLGARIVGGQAAEGPAHGAGVERVLCGHGSSSSSGSASPSGAPPPLYPLLHELVRAAGPRPGPVARLASGQSLDRLAQLLGTSQAVGLLLGRRFSATPLRRGLDERRRLLTPRRGLRGRGGPGPHRPSPPP